MQTRFIHLFILLALVFVSACTPQNTETPTPIQEPTQTSTAPLPSPTPVTRTLTVCLGGEPNTLYPYGNPNSPARSVLSALYDGPIDISEYGYEPVILEKIPNLEDGDAQVAPVTVKAGDQVVDAAGNLVALKAGDRVRPSGCKGNDCAITYDGTSQIQMDQLIVTFTLLEGLMWSDGAPLTAQDSVYSFQLASANDTPGSKFLVDRTQTYEAASDGVTIQWWGKPGFMDSDYYTNFWAPLPQHAWADLTAADLLTADISTRTPLGWGPYLLEEWTAGESLHFTRNLNYFRADDGFPHFDELTFRFYTDPNSALAALVDGTCDLLDPSVQLDGQVGLLQQMQTNNQATLITAPSNTMEWLGIGIAPASYDNGINSSDPTDRPDFFGDARMRQALALCIDRQRIVDTVLFGLSLVPDTYVPSDHPLHNGNVATYSYNPTEGRKTLERIGWLDHDNNPSTPRQALGVTNVPGGTTLILNYVTSTATQRRQVAELITQSLAECGVGLNVTYLSAAELYAQGPAGPLFGRQFELAEYAIGVNALEPQCSWFTTSQIPTALNNWVGTNISGFTNPAFDAACNRALLALPEDPAYTSHQEAQAIFATELPSLPLYQRLKVAAARFDFCGFRLDPFSLYALTGIEDFDYGPTCP